MARNRKNESAVARLAPGLKALVLCSFFVTAGVGYVWYKSQIKVLGDQVKSCENRLVELRRLNKNRRDSYEALCSPLALEARVKQLNLGLGQPALSQVIRISEPPGSDRSILDPRQSRTEGSDRGN